MLDAAQLERQTGGDAALAREVLALFAAELRGALAKMEDLAIEATPAFMHRINGSARAVGAIRLAEAAAALEEMPADAARRRELAETIALTLQALGEPEE